MRIALSEIDEVIAELISTLDDGGSVERLNDLSRTLIDLAASGVYRSGA